MPPKAAPGTLISKQLDRHPTRLACQADAVVGVLWVVGKVMSSL
jgi:hypothetical protein